MYSRLLNDLPPEAILAAVAQHTANCKWFPKVSELRQLAFRATASSPMPTPLDAWGEIKRAIAVVGYYGDPSKHIRAVLCADGSIVIPEWPGWSHPILARVVGAMGWQSLCLSENEMADRAHFLKLYETLAERLRFEQQELSEVRQLRVSMVNQVLAEPKTTPALPEPATRPVASALAMLAERMAPKEIKAPEADSERAARVEAARERALEFLSQKVEVSG